MPEMAAGNDRDAARGPPVLWPRAYEEGSHRAQLRWVVEVVVGFVLVSVLTGRRGVHSPGSSVGMASNDVELRENARYVPSSRPVLPGAPPYLCDLKGVVVVVWLVCVLVSTC